MMMMMMKIRTFLMIIIVTMMSMTEFQLSSYLFKVFNFFRFISIKCRKILINRDHSLLHPVEFCAKLQNLLFCFGYEPSPRIWVFFGEIVHFLEIYFKMNAFI